MTWMKHDPEGTFGAEDMAKAYLEGYSAAQRMFTDEKLPEHKYRKTSFIAWLMVEYPNYHPRPSEDDMKRWLAEFLNS